MATLGTNMTVTGDTTVTNRRQYQGLGLQGHFGWWQNNIAYSIDLLEISVEELFGGVLDLIVIQARPMEPVGKYGTQGIVAVIVPSLFCTIILPVRVVRSLFHHPPQPR